MWAKWLTVIAAKCNTVLPTVLLSPGSKERALSGSLDSLAANAEHRSSWN